MKKNIRVYEKGKYVEKEINYIPFRYIVAVLVTLFEIVSIMAIVFLLAIYVPYFYIALIITEIVVVIGIIDQMKTLIIRFHGYYLLLFYQLWD